MCTSWRQRRDGKLWRFKNLRSGDEVSWSSSEVDGVEGSRFRCLAKNEVIFLSFSGNKCPIPFTFQDIISNLFSGAASVLRFPFRLCVGESEEDEAVGF